MKRFLVPFLAIMSFAVICGDAMTASPAQNARRRTTAAATTERQIMDLRRKVAEAIKTRDREALESIYADDFTHTHASGKVDDKTSRIAALLSGELTIESATADDINIRTYGATTAIVTGQSTIRSQGENQNSTRYRWIAVCVRRVNRWQLVASQATRVAPE